MEIINFDINKIDKNKEKIIIDYFKAGRVLVLLTDTIYGFSCLADNKKAINKIKKIKARDYRKPFILLVSSIKMAEKYCFINKRQKEKLKELWLKKRPTSVILNNRFNLTSSLNQYPSLALRLPKLDFLVKIIRKLGKPLVSTSFNFSQQELININQAELIFSQRKLKPDLIVKSGKNISLKSSLLIDIRGAKNKIIRK